MKVHDFHWSGRYDATEEQWAAAVRNATERADVGAFTEARDRAVPPAGWERWNGGNECPILWDRTIWRIKAALPVVLTNQSWFLGGKVVTGHERHGVVMTCVLLENKFHRATLLRCAYHSPSDVQDGAEWATKPASRDNVAAARGVLRHLGPAVITLQDLLRPDATTISADHNVHLGLKAWRDRIEGHLVGTGLNLLPPSGPTHKGRRKIDAHATTLDPARDTDGDPRPVRMLPKVTGFDHTGFVAYLST